MNQLQITIPEDANTYERKRILRAIATLQAQTKIETCLHIQLHPSVAHCAILTPEKAYALPLLQEAYSWILLLVLLTSNQTRLALPLLELRTLLGIADHLYKEFPFLNNNALKPALDELNAVGFNIEVEFIRKDRRVAVLVFTM